MTNAIPKISVIIPCFNAEGYIQECIESVLNQDYPSIEIIIVDDDSTDQSIQKIEPYLNRVTLLQQSNQGACVARNHGLSVATGNLIKFLDADDYLVPGILKIQVAAITQLQEDEIIFGDLIQKFPHRENIRRYFSFPADKMTETLILNGVLTSLPLHRKPLLDKVGGFDTRFKNGQEWNLHVRLAASGVKFIYKPGSVYYQRFHDGADRISNQKTVTDWDYQIQKRFMTLESIEKLRPITESIKQAMAFNLWKLGRRAWMEDCWPEALKCFQASQQINSNIQPYFSKGFCLMSKLIGSMATEKLVYYRKQFTKWRKQLLSRKKGK